MSRKTKLAAIAAIDLTENACWEERKGFFLRSLDRYVSCQDASLDYTFTVFSHLPIDKRQQLLEQTEYDFFHVLLKYDHQKFIYKILNGAQGIESRKMWSIIHENLKEGLEAAILEGNLAAIEYHMESFPSEKTEKIIKSVLMKNDYALLKEVIKQQRLPMITYFLKHELTQKKMQALSDYRIKPSKNAFVKQSNQFDCLDKMNDFKDRFTAFFRTKKAHVCPDSPATGVENSISVKTDRGF